MIDPCDWVDAANATPHIGDVSDARFLCETAESIKNGTEECDGYANDILGMMHSGFLWTQPMQSGEGGNWKWADYHYPSGEMYFNYFLLGDSTYTTMLHELYHRYYGESHEQANLFAHSGICEVDGLSALAEVGLLLAKEPEASTRDEGGGVVVSDAYSRAGMTRIQHLEGLSDEPN